MNLVKSNSPILSQKSEEVNDPIETAKRYYKVASNLMRRRGGIGLAANQVGIAERWFVWQHGMVINPKIVSYSEETVNSREGCLSFPGQVGTVQRSKTIEVKYTDEVGVERIKKLSALSAIVFQHEYDHLEGKCII